MALWRKLLITMNTYNEKYAECTTKELNNITFRNTLQKVFYDNWKKRENFYSLEVIFSPKCNQGCTYCYLNKDNQHIYSNQDFKEEESLKNVRLILEWLKEMDVAPPQFDIFSGELFAQKVGYDLLEVILNFYDENPDVKKPELFVIPTNGTFVVNEELAEKVKNYIRRFKEKGTRLALSFSIDGLYASKITRKYKRNLDYDLSSSYTDENFYDKAFQFMAEMDCLPHPMISPENISVWKENFLWYEQIMEKYGIKFEELFLLEVRNHNWTSEKIEQYQEFVIFVLEHMRKKYNDDEHFINWLTEFTEDNPCLGFNFLSSMLYNQKRAPSCTLGRQLMIRASDLKVFPCHRLVYPEFEIGHYYPDEEKVLEFDTVAPELGIAILGYNPKAQNICSRCILNYMCMGQCQGACYETTGEVFTPIPSVCNLIYARTKTVLKTIEKMGLLNKYLEHIHNDVLMKNMIYFINNELGE